jgi:hypothetical protein
MLRNLAGRGASRMIIGRFFGLFFVVVGTLVLVRDLWATFVLHSWSPIGLGQLWYDISQSSLVQVQAGTEHLMGVRAWDVIDAMLSIWAFLALLLIGIGLMIAFRRRRDVIE